MTALIVGARRSRLAQRMVVEFTVRLAGCPLVEFDIHAVGSAGDRDRTSLLSEAGENTGTGAFTSQLEAELAAGRVDIAVHSLKDLPTATPAGLSLAVTPPRADVRDALCGSTLAGLRPGARVGTGSPRRIAQMKALRPDVQTVPIRGNVPPRLGKVRSGTVDAVILAAAGLHRLGLDEAIAELLPLEQFPPAPGQGALGIEVRTADGWLLEMLNAYGDPAADAAVRAERALLAALHGGCSVPIGAYAEHEAGGGLVLSAQVTSLDGTRVVTDTLTGSDRDPEALGARLAGRLRDQGAEAILQQIRAPVG